MIEYLLEKTNLTIHYITSDPNDQVFEIAKTNDKLRPYYIGEKRLITLMMKLEADVVVMTMPDLENFHIKRSYLRKDMEYIYVPHGMDSLNLTMRTGSMDHYDTVFCVGKHQREKIEKTEEFKEMLERRTGLTVHLWDERLTTVAADKAMIEAGLRREERKEHVDKVAAVFILQGFLDHKAMQKKVEE